MIRVTKEQKGPVLSIKLIGSVEETENFAQLIGPVSTELEVSCKEIPRLNSIGVKAWIQYFQTCKTNGVKLRFIECSTAIVEQINLIFNFTCGGSVESLYVPFACTLCKGEFVGLFKTEMIQKLQFKIPEMKCPKCGHPSVFDDIAEEYFAFLQRK